MYFRVFCYACCEIDVSQQLPEVKIAMTLTITPAELVDIVQDLPQFPLLPAWDIHCSVDGQTGYCLAVPLTQNLYLFPVQVQSQRTEQASGHCDSSLNRRELQLSGESHVIGIAGIATLIVRRPFGECDIDRIQDQIREAGTGRGTLGKSVFQTAQTGQQNGNIPGITGRLKQRIYLRDMQRGKEVFDIQFQDDRLADMMSGIVFDAPAGTERGRGWMEFHRGKYLSQDAPLRQLQNPAWSFDCPELAVPLGYPEYLVELFRMIGYPVKQLDVDMKKPAQLFRSSRYEFRSLFCF